jgi:hypothetical protein
MLWAFGVSKLLMAPRQTHTNSHPDVYYVSLALSSHSEKNGCEMKFTGSRQHHTAEE